MEISSLWIKRKGNEYSAPELLVAWDEYSIEENWDGWVQVCEAALAACGDDVNAKRFITLHVSTEAIDALFVDGSVTVTRVTETADPSAA